MIKFLIVPHSMNQTVMKYEHGDCVILDCERHFADNMIENTGWVCDICLPDLNRIVGISDSMITEKDWCRCLDD